MWPALEWPGPRSVSRGAGGLWPVEVQRSERGQRGLWEPERRPKAAALWQQESAARTRFRPWARPHRSNRFRTSHSCRDPLLRRSRRCGNSGISKKGPWRGSTTKRCYRWSGQYTQPRRKSLPAQGLLRSGILVERLFRDGESVEEFVGPVAELAQTGTGVELGIEWEFCRFEEPFGAVHQFGLVSGRGTLATAGDFSFGANGAVGAVGFRRSTSASARYAPGIFAQQIWQFKNGRPLPSLSNSPRHDWQINFVGMGHRDEDETTNSRARFPPRLVRFAPPG